jgi:acyl-CoA synthetase (AMP-forming)/AMP-acid ligase II
MPGMDGTAHAFETLDALVAAQARQRPAHLALIQGDARLSYCELDVLADRVAAALQRDGVRLGEAVAIVAANSIPYVAAFLGILRAGAVVAPLAPSSTGDALAAMIADCAAKLLFVDAEASARLGDDQALPPRIALDGADAGFDAWLAPAGARPAPVLAAPGDPFNIIYSSGTTGTPKGIVQSHAMRAHHVARGTLLGYDGQAVAMISTPLYSNTTLVSLIPTLAFGGTAVLMAKFDPAGFLALAELHRATHAMLVPVQYRRIMALPEFDGFDLSAFRMKTSTSAPFDAHLKADILSRWPGGLVEIYGMTEGGGTTTLAAHLHPDKLGTVGRPVEGHDIRVIDADERELPPGLPGEVVGRSPGMMTGYHNRPEGTRAALWFDAEGNRFIRTGDIGRFDADGFLTLIDRKKDMIISGGFNLYPSDLEAVLLGHEAVAEAAVVGVPSDQWGETPVGFVRLHPGSDLTADALRGWFADRVGKTQRLADLVVIPEMPRSAIGKLLKRELREGYLRDAAA